MSTTSEGRRSVGTSSGEVSTRLTELARRHAAVEQVVFERVEERDGLVDRMSVAVFRTATANYELSLAALEAWAARPAHVDADRPKKSDSQLSLVGIAPPPRQGCLF